MDKTSIIVESTNHVSGKNQQLTIQNVNPQASRGHLATWGRMTAALTKDSYGKTVRIDRIECDVDKTARALTIKLVTQSKVDGNYQIVTGTISEGVCTINFAYPAPVRLRVGSFSFETFDALPQFVSECTVTTTMLRDKNFPSSTSTGSSNEVAFDFDITGAQVGDTVTGTFHVPESASYAAVDLPIVINIIGEEG